MEVLTASWPKKKKKKKKYRIWRERFSNISTNFKIFPFLLKYPFTLLKIPRVFPQCFWREDPRVSMILYHNIFLKCRRDGRFNDVVLSLLWECRTFDAHKRHRLCTVTFWGSRGQLSEGSVVRKTLCTKCIVDTLCGSYMCNIYELHANEVDDLRFAGGNFCLWGAPLEASVRSDGWLGIWGNNV